MERKSYSATYIGTYHDGHKRSRKRVALIDIYMDIHTGSIVHAPGILSFFS